MEFILEKSDYHIHTYYSDGTESPSDVVDIFHRKGKEIIAITDHDGVTGIPEAIERAKLYGMTVIPVIEFSTRTSDGDIGIHMLGYGIDIENRWLLESIEIIRKWRQERNVRLIDEINDMGYPLAMEDLHLREGQDFIGKPIIARAMMAKGNYGVQSDFERTITERVNEAGIGALGLGGDHSVIATFAKVGPQRASGVRIVALRPCCCFEPRRASVDL